MNKQFYIIDNKLYSTALMHEYSRICKPTKVMIPVRDLQFNLLTVGWANKINPLDVLLDMKNKKYKEEVMRIKKADTSYPIMLNSRHNIIDGAHRYVKHILENKKKIAAYVFDNKTLKRFLVGKPEDINKITENELIEMVKKRFSTC
jgi:hypothetical protein